MRTNKKKLNPVDFVRKKLGTTLVRQKGKDKGTPVGANEIHIFGKEGKETRVVSRGEAE